MLEPPTMQRFDGIGHLREGRVCCSLIFQMGETEA